MRKTGKRCCQIAQIDAEHILLLLRINGAQLIRLESLTVIPQPMIELDEHIYGQENVLKLEVTREQIGRHQSVLQRGQMMKQALVACNGLTILYTIFPNRKQ